jgi:hypothetical protein
MYEQQFSRDYNRDCSVGVRRKRLHIVPLTNMWRR